MVKWISNFFDSTEKEINYRGVLWQELELSRLRNRLENCDFLSRKPEP